MSEDTYVTEAECIERHARDRNERTKWLMWLVSILAPLFILLGSAAIAQRIVNAQQDERIDNAKAIVKELDARLRLQEANSIAIREDLREIKTILKGGHYNE